MSRPSASIATTPHRIQSALTLAAIGAVSLVLTTTTNRAGGALLRRVDPSVVWLADACVPALLASALLYVLIRPAHAFAAPRPDTNWSLVRRLGAWTLAVWLAG